MSLIIIVTRFEKKWKLNGVERSNMQATEDAVNYPNRTYRHLKSLSKLKGELFWSSDFTFGAYLDCHIILRFIENTDAKLCLSIPL